MKQRTRRRAPRFPTWGFVSVHRGARARLLAVGTSGAGRAKFALKHWARIAALDPGQRITMEIGRWEGFRFIESPWVVIFPDGGVMVDPVRGSTKP